MIPKFSCADFTFPLLEHEKVLTLLRLLDFQAVDIGIFEGRSHHWPSQISPTPSKSARRLQGQLARQHLEVADVFLQTGPEPHVAAVNDPSKAVRAKNRDTFKAMTEYCVELGCRHLTGLPGVTQQGSSSASDWGRAVEETGWRVEWARQAGATYAIEAHVGSILPDAESALRFLSAVRGLTLTLDYGHFVYQGMSNESVHPLLAHASHFHARGGCKGMLQSTMKENCIDFDYIVKALAERDYEGFLCLEYVWVDWEGCNRTDNIAETLLLKSELESIALAGRRGEKP